MCLSRCVVGDGGVVHSNPTSGNGPGRVSWPGRVSGPGRGQRTELRVLPGTHGCTPRARTHAHTRFLGIHIRTHTVYFYLKSSRTDTNTRTQHVAHAHTHIWAGFVLLFSFQHTHMQVYPMGGGARSKMRRRDQRGGDAMVGGAGVWCGLVWSGGCHGVNGLEWFHRMTWSLGGRRHGGRCPWCGRKSCRTPVSRSPFSSSDSFTSGLINTAPHTLEQHLTSVHTHTRI